MSSYSPEIHKLQVYAAAHWNKKYDNVRYTKTFWALIDSCKADIESATRFVEQYLPKGTVPDRVLAAVLAGQICNPIEPEIKKHTERISDVVIAAANTEMHTSVLLNIADSLRFMQPSPELIKITNKLTFHSDDDVRFYAARSLSNLVDDDYASDEIIDRLIELSADKDADIRDWSTNGLSGLVEFWEIDKPKIKDAFLARVKDRHNDTRAEAFYGLAISQDERGIKPFKKYLESSKSIGKLDIAAAKEYAQQDLYEALLKIQEWWDIDKQLMNEAVLACKPAKK